MWLADSPELRYTMIVVAFCIAINMTLPIWLCLAKICDNKKLDGNEDILEGSEISSDDENNTKGSNKAASSMSRSGLSVVSESQYSAIGSLFSAVSEARMTRTGRRANHSKRRKRERDIRLAAGMQKLKVDARFDRIETTLRTNDNFSTAKSVMSKLNVDDISMDDGANEKKGIETTLHKRRSCWRVILEASEWDSSLASLTGFYMVQDMAEQTSNLVTLAVISHMIGIAEANAYMMVDFLFLISGLLVVGFEEAIGILVPQADGAGNDLLVGRYLQIGIVFTILLEIPGFLIWSFYMYDTIIWFGFDETTAIIAQNYAYGTFIMMLADDINNCLVRFLDVLDREKYITIYSVISECIAGGVLVALAWYGVSDMFIIGLAESLVSVTVLFVNITIVMNKGWLDDYMGGLVKSFGLKDWRAMRNTFNTAVPLAIVWLLSIGEWQLMIIFARSIGPDEVAAWSILGFIWELFEALTYAISGAAEVRVGFRMGAGLSQQARQMSEKSLYIGTQLAILTAGGLFAGAEFLLPLLTPNLIYQKLVFDVLPLVGFAEICMVPFIILEGIFKSQGRVRLMTTVELIVSWCIAIPISALLTYYSNFNLIGIVSGLVLGYTTGSTILSFYFLRSNWEELSENVIEENAAEGLQHLDTEWDELPEEVQKAASTLGYTEVMWESNMEPDSTDKLWDALTEAERNAAVVLGYDKKKWNGKSGIGKYDECDFDDLPIEVKEAAKLLGFTPSIWDNDGNIPIKSTDWADLTVAQQNAASTLGYTKEKWNDGSSSSSSSSDDSAFQGILTMPFIDEEETAATSVLTKAQLVDYNDYDFEELPTKVKKAAKLLGYSPRTWNTGGSIPIENEDWADLTVAQQNAACTLGYTRIRWDYSEPPAKAVVYNKKNASDSTVPWDEPQDNFGSSVTIYGEYRFDELPSDIQRSAMVLGFTRSTWDRNLFFPRKNKTWDNLTPAEMVAALSLGCTEEKWETLWGS